MRPTQPPHTFPEPAIVVPAYQFREGRTGGQRMWRDFVDLWKRHGLPVICEDEIPAPPSVSRFVPAALWYRKSYGFLRHGVCFVDSSSANRLHLLMRALRRRPGIRLVVLVHHLRHEFRWMAGPLFRLLQHQENWLLRNAHRVVLHTEKERNSVISRGVDPSRITLIPLGVEREGPPVVIRDLPPDESMRLLWVGGDFDRKGMRPLLEAMAREQGPGSVLTVAGAAGSPEEEQRARDNVKRLHLEARTNFLGHIPRSELRAEHESHDVFVAPSAHEGHGIAVDEALACGLPCLLTDLPAFRERLADTDVRFVPVGDITALHQALTDLRGGDLRRRLAKAGAARAATFPSYEDTIAGYDVMMRQELELVSRG